MQALYKLLSTNTHTTMLAHLDVVGFAHGRVEIGYEHPKIEVTHVHRKLSTGMRFLLEKF